MPAAPLSTLDSVRSGGIFKYVRLGSEFRFLAIEALPNHSDAVDEGELPTSAGTVRVNGQLRTVEMASYGSMTLGISYSDSTDLPEIDKLLWGERPDVVHGWNGKTESWFCGAGGRPPTNTAASVSVAGQLLGKLALGERQRWCEQCLTLRDYEMARDS